MRASFTPPPDENPKTGGAEGGLPSRAEETNGTLAPQEPENKDRPARGRENQTVLNEATASWKRYASYHPVLKSLWAPDRQERLFQGDDPAANPDYTGAARRERGPTGMEAQRSEGSTDPFKRQLRDR
jgi:hypothetical protein